MKSRHALFAATALVAALAAAGTALAHPNSGRGQIDPATVSTRLADTKAALKISADQEGAWNAYAAVVTRQAEARKNMREKMHAAGSDPQASAPNHAAMRETMQKFQQDMRTQRSAALKDLVAVLTPEQKALAERQLGGQRMAGGHGGGRMGGHGGHGGHGRGADDATRGRN